MPDSEQIGKCIHGAVWGFCPGCSPSDPRDQQIADLRAEVELLNSEMRDANQLTKLAYHELSNAEAERDKLAACIGEAKKALEAAHAQLSVGRRFLPKHGSFGEEGISAYEEAQSAVILSLGDLSLIDSTCAEAPKPDGLDRAGDGGDSGESAADREDSHG